MDKRLKLAADVGRLFTTSVNEVYRGWGTRERLSREVRERGARAQRHKEHATIHALACDVRNQQIAVGLKTDDDVFNWALGIVEQAMRFNGAAHFDVPLRHHLLVFMSQMIAQEKWHQLPVVPELDAPKSELWAWEDKIRRVGAVTKDLDGVTDVLSRYVAVLIKPLVQAHPSLLHDQTTSPSAIIFPSHLKDAIDDISACVERLIKTSFESELEPLGLTEHLRDVLFRNTVAASGGIPGQPFSNKSLKLPTKNRTVSPDQAAQAYLRGTPLYDLLHQPLPVHLPDAVRFEHMHIVAGSGHGKTQTLQHLIIRDLEAVHSGKASLVVMDSQSDLINTIARLDVFAPGGPMADRLVHIDPTDIEWPVALNLFDTGLDRLADYNPLERERLTNSILELYDFVLGSLLDAGMTQKQTVIFRYITRLILHIPDATIHTLRELLEDGGSDKYQRYIDQLRGSAKAFFDTEFNGREFVATKRQVVRRLYGILENQTMERMFSHPKSKLDLFGEMNAGKVILINTAKDLLKEQGTEILGRFFIAMIAQAAQERAVLAKSERLATYVYIDEASDYFDRNIGIILSQARKYNVGMVLAHQFLGQLEPRLHEAIAANTSIKFAGGVSAKDARALANDLRTDAAFIERQEKFNFAAFIKGQTKRAISLNIAPGQMEALPRMKDEDRARVRDTMRTRYAVHHSELDGQAEQADTPLDGEDEPANSPTDDGAPMPWPE